MTINVIIRAPLKWLLMYQIGVATLVLLYTHWVIVVQVQWVNTFKKSGNENHTLLSQQSSCLKLSIRTWSTFKDSNQLIFPALGAMCKWQQILYEQNGRLWLCDCFYILSWFGNSLNKIILQAVTTTHLIKYNSKT